MTGRGMHTNNVFIVGYSRSGTKLLCNLIEQGSDGDCEHVGELHYFGRLRKDKELIKYHKKELIIRKLIQQYSRRKNFPFLDKEKLVAECISDATKLTSNDDVLQSTIDTIARLRQINTICDGTPRNIYYLDEILNTFPKAKIIYMLRDPRDCIASQKIKHIKALENNDALESSRLQTNYNPAIMSLFWKSSLNCYKQFSKDPRVFAIKYEELLAEPKDTLENLSDFLGYPDICKNWDQIKSNNRGKFKNVLNSTEISAIEFSTSAQLLSEYEITNPRHKLVSFIPFLGYLIKFLILFPSVYFKNRSRFQSLSHEAAKRLK